MALTTSETELVLATVPILEAGGEQLTRHFYKRMMSHNPEVRKFFNQTHQKDGTQAKALARAVLLYAKNINSLENIGGVAEVIIQKHVALDIQAEQYPIVGTNLLASMREVLGPETATEDIMEAWAKAYNQLADILIKAERDVYNTIEHTQGGWAGFRAFELQKRVKETSDIDSFVFVPKDGGPVYQGKAGQYITVRVEIDGQEHRRNYTVSSAPNAKDYRITVKNIGTVSGYLHNLKEGDVVDLRPPCGEFFVDSTVRGNLLFIAGGVGITPVASMALDGNKGTLLYYARDANEHALAHELKNLDDVKFVPAVGKPALEDLKPFVNAETQVYTTGPYGFMESVHNKLLELGLPAEQAHYEFFGSFQNL